MNTPPDECLIHQRPLVVSRWCPVCRGRAGGKRISAKKTRASRRNARKPRPRQHEEGA